jgi:hypothetical protein
MTGAGTITNDISEANAFQELSIGQPTFTTTILTGCRCRKLHIGSGIVGGGNIIWVYADANDALDINSSAAISSTILLFLSADRTQGAVSCVGWVSPGNFYHYGAGKLTLTGAWNTPNADFLFSRNVDFNDQNVTFDNIKCGQSSNNTTMWLGTGTINCTSFVRASGASGTNNVDMESASLNCSGTMDFTNLVVTKGTGIITLTGSSGTQTIDFDGKLVEDVVINCSGATKQFTEDFSTDSLSGTAGAIQGVADTGGEYTIIAPLATGVMSNITISNLYLNAANMVNAKNNCINSGNTKGFVFKDLKKRYR